MRAQWLLAMVSCLLVPRALPQQAAAAAEAEVTANDILDRMARAYEDCSSYRDTGIVSALFVTRTGSRVVETNFRTALRRPAAFRFEYWKRDMFEDRFVIWAESDDVRTWWSLEGNRAVDSLREATSAAAGVSTGTSLTIPSLLLPGTLAGVALSEMRAARRLADADLLDVRCFRVEGVVGEERKTLWIDHATSLVRRIEEDERISDFRVLSATTFEPAIDEDIPASLLTFETAAERLRTEARRAADEALLPAGDWRGIKLIGPPAFIERMRAALDRLAEADEDSLDLVLGSVKELRRAPRSGADPTAGVVSISDPAATAGGRSAVGESSWCAGVVVHEAMHCFQHGVGQDTRWERLSPEQCHVLDRGARTAQKLALGSLRDHGADGTEIDAMIAWLQKLDEEVPVAGYCSADRLRPDS